MVINLKYEQGQRAATAAIDLGSGIMATPEHCEQIMSSMASVLCELVEDPGDEEDVFKKGWENFDKGIGWKEN